MIKALDRKVKKFEPGKRYIFDFETLKKSDKIIGITNRESHYLESDIWEKSCDQKEVKVKNDYNGEIKVGCIVFSILPWWCKEIIEVKEEKQQPLTYTIGELFNLKGMF